MPDVLSVLNTEGGVYAYLDDRLAWSMPGASFLTVAAVCRLLDIRLNELTVKWDEWKVGPGDPYHPPETFAALMDRLTAITERRRQNRIKELRDELKRLEQTT